MRAGARDYIEKPWDNERLLTTLRLQVELRRTTRVADRLHAQSAREQQRELPELVAVSKAMEPVIKLMERVAGSDANVLITGEHGTGKDVVARWIHAASGRAQRAFVPVNAGALADGGLRERAVRAREGAHSPMPRRTASGASSSPTEARSFSTRSARCLRRSRRSSCGCCRAASSRRSGPHEHGARTYASSPRPTSTSRRRWEAVRSDRTSSIGSTPSRSSCLRSALARRTSSRSACTFSA